MTPDQQLQLLHRFAELAAAYEARFEHTPDVDAVDDVDLAQICSDMERGLARGEPIPYLFPPSDTVVRSLRQAARKAAPR